MRGEVGKSGYMGIGVVISGTQPDFLKRFRRKYDRLFFLVPGYGSWGAYGKDVQHAFDLAGHGRGDLRRTQHPLCL